MSTGSTQRWTETVSDGGTSVTIVVDAVDVGRTERNEMESFRRALTAPAQERGVQIRDRHGDLIDSRAFLRLVFAIGYLIAAVLAAAIVGGGAGLYLFAFACVAPLLIAIWRHLRSRPGRVGKVHGRFTVSLERAGFSITGAATELRCALEEIERFEDAGRLVLLATDGSRKPLGLSLGSHDENASLAERLNDALREVRANVGYRGQLPGPRVETGQLVEEVAEDPRSHARTEN